MADGKWIWVPKDETEATEELSEKEVRRLLSNVMYTEVIDDRMKDLVSGKFESMVLRWGKIQWKGVTDENR
jgi:hypothetical protein